MFQEFGGIGHLQGFNPAFYPGSRRLEENMPNILDCAPTVSVYTVDTGYCGCVGSNPLLDQVMGELTISPKILS